MSGAVQVPAVCTPIVCGDPVKFEYVDGHVSENKEENIGLALNKTEQLVPNRRARIMKQATKEQLAVQEIKFGYHHGQFRPFRAH